MADPVEAYIPSFSPHFLQQLLSSTLVKVVQKPSKILTQEGVFTSSNVAPGAVFERVCLDACEMAPGSGSSVLEVDGKLMGDRPLKNARLVDYFRVPSLARYNRLNFAYNTASFVLRVQRDSHGKIVHSIIQPNNYVGHDEIKDKEELSILDRQFLGPKSTGARAASHPLIHHYWIVCALFPIPAGCEIILHARNPLWSSSNPCEFLLLDDIRYFSSLPTKMRAGHVCIWVNEEDPVARRTANGKFAQTTHHLQSTDILLCHDVAEDVVSLESTIARGRAGQITYWVARPLDQYVHFAKTTSKIVLSDVVHYYHPRNILRFAPLPQPGASLVAELWQAASKILHGVNGQHQDKPIADVALPVSIALQGAGQNPIRDAPLEGVKTASDAPAPVFLQAPIVPVVPRRQQIPKVAVAVAKRKKQTRKHKSPPKKINPVEKKISGQIPAQVGETQQVKKEIAIRKVRLNVKVKPKNKAITKASTFVAPQVTKQVKQEQVKQEPAQLLTGPSLLPLATQRVPVDAPNKHVPQHVISTPGSPTLVSGVAAGAPTSLPPAADTSTAPTSSPITAGPSTAPTSSPIAAHPSTAPTTADPMVTATPIAPNPTTSAPIRPIAEEPSIPSTLNALTASLGTLGTLGSLDSLLSPLRSVLNLASLASLLLLPSLLGPQIPQDTTSTNGLGAGLAGLPGLLSQLAALKDLGLKPNKNVEEKIVQREEIPETTETTRQLPQQGEKEKVEKTNQEIKRTRKPATKSKSVARGKSSRKKKKRRRA